MSVTLYLLVIVLFSFQTFFCNGNMHLTQITQAIDHGEGPTWDSRKYLLYFVDIHAGNIYSYDYDTKELNFIHLNGEVSPVVPSKKDPGLLLAGVNRTLFAIEWNGKTKYFRTKPLTTISRQFPQSRFNDGKADSDGRLWIGTIGFEDSNGVSSDEGVLYQITHNNLQNPRVMIAPVNISNGLAWNKANNKFYYIDTPTRKIVQYEYDSKKGLIKNGRTIFDLRLYPSIKGSPDGMTIDVDDNLWVAVYGGGAVLKINPKTKDLLQIVSIPATAVTSVIFGGPNLDILYVTTSRFRLTEDERKQQPYAGSVFALTGTGTKGREEYQADIISSI